MQEYLFFFTSFCFEINPISLASSCQTSSRLHKTVIDYDYDYFQFMKDDYNYIFTFARWITITIIHFLKF